MLPNVSNEVSFRDKADQQMYLDKEGSKRSSEMLLLLESELSGQIFNFRYISGRGGLL